MKKKVIKRTDKNDLLYVLGHMTELKDKDFIDGPMFLNEDGMKAFKKLQDTGYTIDDKTLFKIIDELQNYTVKDAKKLFEEAKRKTNDKKTTK